MLSKLFKHEFRATGRIMGPVYLVLLAASVGANISFRVLLDSEYSVLNLLGGLLMMGFVLSIIAVFLVAFLLMVQRFYKNLLQDEGYVMLTLPVSIHQHIWTKLVVSAVWFAATFLAVIAAAFISAFDIVALREFFRDLAELFPRLLDLLHLHPSDVANILIICAEMLVLAFVSSCATCLQFYASLAIGHSAASHKLAWSVAAYLGISFVMQMVSGIGMIFMGELTPWKYFNWHLEGYAGIHAGIWIMIIVMMVYGVIYYPLTVWFMNRRLNLD